MGVHHWTCEFIVQHFYCQTAAYYIQYCIIYSTVYLQPAFIKDVNFMCSNSVCVCVCIWQSLQTLITLWSWQNLASKTHFHSKKINVWLGKQLHRLKRNKPISFSILAQLATTTHTSVSSLFLTRVPRISRREGFMRNIFDLKHPIIADSALLL